MRKATKIVISFAVVLIAGLNFIVPAFAQDPFTAVAVGGLTGASGAGLFGSMASLSGVEIGWSSDGSDPMDAMWNTLNPNHVYFSGEKHEATNIGEDVFDYINVDIGDWLEAQNSFISEFISENGVTDNSSGTVNPSQNYSFDGLPMYPITNTAMYKSDQSAQLVFNPSDSDPGGILLLGSGKATFEYIPATNRHYLVNIYFGDTKIYSADVEMANGNQRLTLMYFANTYNATVDLRILSSGQYLFRSGNTGQRMNHNSAIPWTSNTVNDNVFDNWGSAKVKIPTNVSHLQAGWTLSDFLDELDRIWSGAGEDNIIIEDGSYVPPVPPTPVPVPDTPLGDLPFDDWVDLWGQGIYEQLENQSDALDFIGSNGEDQLEELESIDSNLGDIAGTAESIDTNIGIGNGILDGIKSGVESAVDFLEGIAEHVEELVEEIVEGTETLIAGILNQIPQAFGVIFRPIKQASSIWHYVVEWVQSIGAPFQFIWSMASGTSYYIILPVYASLAAAVVLAFYKRFGK